MEQTHTYNYIKPIVTKDIPIEFQSIPGQAIQKSTGVNKIDVKPAIPPLATTLRKKSSRELQAKIRKLYFINKWSESEISQALHISIKAVERHISLLKKMGREMAEKDKAFKSDVINLFFELNEDYNERIKKLWNEYNLASFPDTKISAIREIREQEKQHITILQSIGLIPKEADKSIQGIVYISHLKTEEKKDVINAEVKDIKEEVKNEKQTV